MGSVHYPILAAVTLALAIPVAAQEPEPVATRPVFTRPPVADSVTDSVAAQDSAPRKPGCWRAQPAPICAGYFLTEIGVETPLRSSRSRRDGVTRPDFAPRLNWAIGLMASSGRNSHGGAIAMTSELGSSINIAEYRYRRWMGTSTLDVGIGYKTNDVPDSLGAQRRGKGATAMLGYTPNRWIGVQLRGEWVRSRGRTHHALLVGVQSTRVSEYVFRGLFYAAIRALFERFGIEWEGEEE